jgi:hypothetical protein
LLFSLLPAERVGIAVTLWIPVLVVLCSNLGRDTCCPEGFHGFPYSLHTNAGVVSFRPRRLATRSFLIHSLVIISSRVLVTIDGVWTGTCIYWTLTLVNTNNYGSLTELHTAKITVTAAHIESSQSSLAVAW